MDYFNNLDDDNSKQNEVLLDIVMEEHKKRKNKYNIKEGYLVSKNNDKELEVEEDNDKQQPTQPKPVQAQPEPMFVIGKGGPKQSKAKKNIKSAIIISIVTLVLVISAIIIGIYFFAFHDIKVLCGNREGIIFVDENDKVIDKLSLRRNDKIKFKIKLTPGYSDSLIDVLYNEKEIEADKDGYYTIEFISDDTSLRILGVTQNKYTLTFESNDDFDFIDATVDTHLVLNQSSNYYGRSKQFKVVYRGTNYEIEPQFCVVYANNKRIIPDENNVYTIAYDENYKLKSYSNSPFEYFEFAPNYDTDSISILNYKIVGITEQGLNAKQLYLPNAYLGKKAVLELRSGTYYPQIEKIYINGNYELPSADQFDYFNDLQEINVINAATNGPITSINGILYGFDQNAKVISELIKVPVSYNKNNSVNEDRVLSINAKTIKNYSITQLNYIDKVIFSGGVQKVEQNAFLNKTEKIKFDIEFTSNQYCNMRDDGVLVEKTSGTLEIVVAAPLAEGKVELNGTFIILDNAFAYSNIEELVLIGTCNVREKAFANMPKLKKVVMPYVLMKMSDTLFEQSPNVEVIDLSNCTEFIKNIDICVKNLTKLNKIIVPSEDLEQYKTTYVSLVNFFESGQQ